MIDNKFKRAIELIDQANKQDPNHQSYQGKPYPKEYLYSLRMSSCLDEYEPDASVGLKIAAHAQHIQRWKIARNSFPMDRVGYHSWRNKLKKYHAEIASDILTEVGYHQDIIDQVSYLLQKKGLKTNTETQTLEDVICLVFIQFYMEDFAKDYPKNKMISIVQKTWKKMSAKGQQRALELDLSPAIIPIIKEALA